MQLPHPSLQASWERCREQYGIDPRSRLLGNRFSQAEVAIRHERIEEPLIRAEPLLHRIREVIKHADYCLLIADADGAAIAEYCDSTVARELKAQGIEVGTLWDEPCVGTNGVGTALASSSPVTVNGDQHYHSYFRRFICSAAPLIDHKGERFGALNLTGKATDREVEVERVSQYVRASASKLHTLLFRNFFRHCSMVAITDSPFAETSKLSRLLAIDETGRIAGVTNDMIVSLGQLDRNALIGMPIDKLICLDHEKLASTEARRQLLEEGVLSGRFAMHVPPGEKRQVHVNRDRGNAMQHCNTGTNGADDAFGLDALAGDDARMKKSVRLCRRMLNGGAADGGIPILLQGETGTGKDTFARALHAESPRSNQPFVALNCAAIPESLIDSELFGYAPGTFTGGLKAGKDGTVLAANGGTLFLDEIGDMPIDSQTRLLRVLAERQVQPLGSARSVAVDFQLVCASHRNLMELVQEGRFREDLYYRVCGAKITLTALRDRGDFEGIARKQLKQFASDCAIRFDDALWNHLRRYAWPGNIRQLGNVIQYIACSCETGMATVADLPEDLLADNDPGQILDVSAATSGSFPARTRQPVTGGTTSATGYLSCARTVTGQPPCAPYRSPCDTLADALHHNRWCVTDAARELGISRATVHRQMKKFGIVRPDHQ